MLTFEVNFEVLCAGCGSDLTDQSEVDWRCSSKKYNIVKVSPCPKCIPEIEEEVKHG